MSTQIPHDRPIKATPAMIAEGVKVFSQAYDDVCRELSSGTLEGIVGTVYEAMAAYAELRADVRRRRNGR